MSSPEPQGPARRRQQKSLKPVARNRQQKSRKPSALDMSTDPAGLHGRSSSLQRNQASIRPPHSANGHDYGGEEEEEVELSLLGEQERRQAALGVDTEDMEEVSEKMKAPLSRKDKQAMTLLIILCTLLSNGICQALAEFDPF